MFNEEPMQSIVDLVLMSCELTEDEFEVDDLVADAVARSSSRIATLRHGAIPTLQAA